MASSGCCHESLPAWHHLRKKKSNGHNTNKNSEFFCLKSTISAGFHVQGLTTSPCSKFPMALIPSVTY